MNREDGILFPIMISFDKPSGKLIDIKPHSSEMKGRV
jgi:hypothetical protein